MNNSYSDHPELDFLDEEPTDPYRSVTAQLNNSVSVVAELTARATVLGYQTDAPKHWTTRLSDELDSIPVEEIVVSQSMEEGA